MPPLETLLAFIAASIAVTLSPGPDNLMVLAQGIARGQRAGLGVALGCALGCFTHTLWATLGVSALLLASPNAFMALKFAGAAYLAWLGVQALRSRGSVDGADVAVSQPVPWYRHVARGFIANAINPKVALFFLAFLPQFTQPVAGNPSLQMLVLGAVFAAQTVVVFGTIALASARIGRMLARAPQSGMWLDRLAGCVFIGLAAHLALSSGKH